MAEYTSTGWVSPLSWKKSYVYAGDSLLSTYTDNGGGETLEFHHPDRLGTKLVTNHSNNALNYEQSTLPFGTALTAEDVGTSTNNRKFTSYQRSDVTKLDYAVNRSYSSAQGRFTQVDPIEMSSSSLIAPQTLNLYSYCGNDPINHTDPDGLFFSAIGRFFQKIGRAIKKVLGNIVVQVVLNVLAIIVTFGMSAIASFSVMFGAKIVIPIGLKILSGVLTAASWASKIGTTLELTGLMLQGKWKELGKTVGLGFVGALVGIVEDSIFDGAYGAFKNGDNILKGAWNGFKKGLSRLKTVFTRKFKDFFIAVYGFFCGPGYGLENEGLANSQSGSDKLDNEGCKSHDENLEMRKRQIQAGVNPKSLRSVTYLDWQLIKTALTATANPRFTDIAFGGGHRIGNIYGFTVPFAFGIRIAKNRGK